MSFVRRLVTLLTLVALLLPGLLAQPVAARQCLRIQAVEHCIEMGNPVAKFADHAAPTPALLPEEVQPALPQATRHDWVVQAEPMSAQAEALPRLRPPRG